MNITDKFEERPYLLHRKIVSDMVELSSMKHQMSGSMEIDVTEAREILRSFKSRTGESQSFTAWFIKCVAQAVSENKAIHGLRKGKKIVIFDDVDVFIMIETMVDNTNEALPYVIRKADKKNCREIHEEIRTAQKEKVSGTSMVIGRSTWLMDIYPHIPKILRMLICRIVCGNPFYIKKNTGTVSVSSVGMMGSVNARIKPISPLPLSFAVCGITKKPGVVNEKIEIREILNVTFAADHDIIDGAPLVRFLSRLKNLMETAYNLDTLNDCGSDTKHEF